MKKISQLIALFVCGAMMFTACYDDSDLQKRIGDAETEISNLKTAVSTLNNDYSTLRGLVEKLQNAVTVDKVEKTATGYTIYFSDKTTAVITNGEDGYSPVISIAKDTDGCYYWTMDGAWMTDASGNKFPAQGTTPEVKVEDSFWFVSTDGGKTWKNMGAVIPEQINTVFSGVEETDSAVIFTLTDGSAITISKTVAFSFSLGEADYDFTGDYIITTLNYTITGAASDLEIGVICGQEIEYAVKGLGLDSSGIITIKAKDDGTAIKAWVYASTSSNSVIREVTIGKGAVKVDAPAEGIIVDEEGGNVVFSIVSSGVDVVVPAEADWLTYVATKAAALDRVYFVAEPNTATEPREADVKVGAKTVKIIQRAAFDPADGIQALYLGDSAMPAMDMQTGMFMKYYEYYLEVPVDGGELLLAINGPETDDPLAGIPTGTFTVDSFGLHSAGTFTFVYSGEEKFTAFKSGTLYIPIVDGTIEISEKDGLYTITAALVDEAGEEHNGTATTKVAVKDCSFGVSMATGFFDGAGWGVNAYVGGKPSPESIEITMANFAFFGNGDETDIPSGRYEVGNMYTMTGEPFTATLYGYTIDTEMFLADSGYFYVEANGDGTYFFSFDLVGNVMSMMTGETTNTAAHYKGAITMPIMVF